MLDPCVCIYPKNLLWEGGRVSLPDVEPDRVQLLMRACGDLSVYERGTLLKEFESRILDMKEFSTIYSCSDVNLGGRDITEDTHGIILLEFADWRKRRKAKEILEEVAHRVSDLGGIIIELKEEKIGPSCR